jgi:hypothetical protein
MFQEALVCGKASYIASSRLAFFASYWVLFLHRARIELRRFANLALDRTDRLLRRFLP